MEWPGSALALTRGLHLAGTLSVFGTLTAMALVAPAVLGAAPQAAPAIDAALRRVARIGIAAAALALLPWLAVQSFDMAGAASLGELAAAIPDVLLDTRFGHTLLLRAAMLAAVALLLRGRAPQRWQLWLALLPAAIAVAAQSWAGHPGSSEDWLLLAASMLHVLAAGAWLGGLLPLLLLIRAAPGRGAALAAGRFGWIGIVAVLILAVTALAQSWTLIGGYAGAAATAYGQIALFKLLLFAVLLALAAINRVRLTPALAAPLTRERAARHIQTSVIAETAIGTLVVLSAAWLASQTPAAHAQPEWPFALRPNVSILADPDVRRAFIIAAVALALALAMLCAALLFRRWRWLALAAVPALGYYAVTVVDDAPFLDPMLVEAYPTTFYRSPTGFTPGSIMHGAGLFAANCTVCHGVDGRGDGPLAKQLSVKPANLVAEHVWGHADGELFWWLSHGIRGPKGQPAMPAFASVLSEDDRWALIDYLHAHLAGTAKAAGKPWRNPVTPPALEATCSDGRSLTLDDLRGRFVRIVAGDAAVPVLPEADAITLQLLLQPSELPGCTFGGPDIWAAYAVMAGVAPDALAGTQFLIDPSGWLRAGLTQRESGAWMTAEGMTAAMRDAAAHPMAAAAHHHH